MSGSRGLTKLAIALARIFVVSLLALIAQLFYFFFFCRCRRTFNGSGGAVGHIGLYSASNYSFSSSKELLYFFCLRSQQSRINESNFVMVVVYGLSLNPNR